MRSSRPERPGGGREDPQRPGNGGPVHVTGRVSMSAENRRGPARARSAGALAAVLGDDGSEQRYRVVVMAIEQLRPGVSVVPERWFGSSGSRLFGREAEAAVLDRLVTRIRGQGGALVVRGDPGIGKTALLAAASDAAGSAGVSVLRTAGTQSEMGLAFAGLHQLLRPVLARLDRLP